MPRYLFIVAKEHPELCAHLEREFTGEGLIPDSVLPGSD